MIDLATHLLLTSTAEARAACTRALDTCERFRAWVRDTAGLTLGPAPLRPNTSRALTHEGSLALKFARSAAYEPGPRGPAFLAYWQAFLAHDAACSLAAKPHDREGDCPFCDPRASSHDCEQRRRTAMFAAADELKLRGSLYDSERFPPAKGAKFYVTTVYGGEFRLLVGPLDTHEEALRLVPRTRREAAWVDRRAHLYAYGTASHVPAADGSSVGLLNDRVLAPEEVEVRTAGPAPKRRPRKAPEARA